MKKIMSILLVVLVLSTILCGCGKNDAPAKAEVSANDSDGATEESISFAGYTPDNPLVLRLANASAVGEIKDQVAVMLADLVNERSNGCIQIQVYSGGVLGDWTDTIEGLKMDMDEIVLEGFSSYASYDLSATLDAIPYLFESYEHFMNVYQGELGQEVLDFVGERCGFKFIGAQYRGYRVTTSNVKFTTLEELQNSGLKIRVPSVEAYVYMWEDLGVSPVVIGLTDTFTALQQGTVDAQENSVIESYGHGFFDVCDYLIRTNHICGCDVFAFDLEYWNSLPEEVQTLLVECANEAALWRSEFSYNEEENYIEKWKEAGVEIIDVDMSEFADELADFADIHYPELTEWVDRIMAAA